MDQDLGSLILDLNAKANKAGLPGLIPYLQKDITLCQKVIIDTNLQVSLAPIDPGLANAVLENISRLLDFYKNPQFDRNSLDAIESIVATTEERDFIVFGNLTDEGIVFPNSSVLRNVVEKIEQVSEQPLKQIPNHVFQGKDCHDALRILRVNRLVSLYSLLKLSKLKAMPELLAATTSLSNEIIDDLVELRDLLTLCSGKFQAVSLEDYDFVKSIRELSEDLDTYVTKAWLASSKAFESCDHDLILVNKNNESLSIWLEHAGEGSELESVEDLDLFDIEANILNLVSPGVVYVARKQFTPYLDIKRYIELGFIDSSKSGFLINEEWLEHGVSLSEMRRYSRFKSFVYSNLKLRPGSIEDNNLKDYQSNIKSFKEILDNLYKEVLVSKDEELVTYKPFIIFLETYLNNLKRYSYYDGIYNPRGQVQNLERALKRLKVGLTTPEELLKLKEYIFRCFENSRILTDLKSKEKGKAAKRYLLQKFYLAVSRTPDDVSYVYDLNTQSSFEIANTELLNEASLSIISGDKRWEVKPFGYYGISLESLEGKRIIMNSERYTSEVISTRCNVLLNRKCYSSPISMLPVREAISEANKSLSKVTGLLKDLF